MRTAFVLTALVGFASADACLAQGPSFRPGPGGGSFGQGGIGNTPAVSPYMNLFRRGSSVAVNYYGLVRPALDFQGAINNLQQQVTDMPAPGTGSGNMDGMNPLLTGSRSRFMNTGNYFLSGVPMGNRTGGFGSGGGSGSITIVNSPSNAPAGGSTPATTTQRR